VAERERNPRRDGDGNVSGTVNSWLSKAAWKGAVVAGRDEAWFVGFAPRARGRPWVRSRGSPLAAPVSWSKLLRGRDESAGVWDPCAWNDLA
jgi:hypothetical protein